jgi:hypothetical protein
MKKIIYTITSLSHKRVFESFDVRSDVKQMIVGPVPKITNGIIPEDYRDFKIKNIRLYKNKKEIQNIVNKFKPNIYVEASLPVARGIKLPIDCRKVYVSHGMVGNHVKDIIKKAGFNTSVWKGCDLYCGATKIFENWVKHVAKVDESKILLNALPQLDILHDPDYYDSYRRKVLATTKNPNAKKVLLFVGFCCKDRIDFNSHNEDYFRAVIELEKIARKNNWLVMVKPRQTFNNMMKFLYNHSWGRKYIEKYKKIQQSKYLHFITTTGHIYRYFFSDLIVLNGTSTVEIETCAINKPLFIIKTQCKDDPYDTIKTGCATHVSDLNKLEYYFTNYKKFHCPNKQKYHILNAGILFDGKMHKRIQDKLVTL